MTWYAFLRLPKLDSSGWVVKHIRLHLDSFDSNIQTGWMKVQLPKTSVDKHMSITHLTANGTHSIRASMYDGTKYCFGTNENEINETDLLKQVNMIRFSIANLPTSAITGSESCAYLYFTKTNAPTSLDGNILAQKVISNQQFDDTMQVFGGGLVSFSFNFDVQSSPRKASLVFELEAGVSKGS